MKKTVGATILSTALVCGLGLPAHALGVPGSDPAEGAQGGTVQVLAGTATPAAAAQLRPSLRLGSRSPAVVYVQTKLGVKPASGYYGPITAKAVRAAQRSHGLKATGKVSASTWKVLLRSASTTAPAADPAPEPSEQPACPRAEPEGGRREEALAQHGLPRSGGGVRPGEARASLLRPGTTAPLTRGAVRTLQEINDLKVTGKVGPATWKILLAAEGVIELPLDARGTGHAARSRHRPRPPPAPPAPARAPPALTPEQAAAARPLLTAGDGPR